MRFSALVGLLLVAVGCGTPSAASPPTPKPVASSASDAGVAATAPTPPKLRLPAGIKPVRYDVALTLDPASTTFDGEIAIDLEIASPTDTLWLHAEELQVANATLIQGGHEQALTAWTAPHTFVSLRGAFAAGSARVVIRYQGKLARNQHAGAYVLDDEGSSYVYTQFESVDARRAFPCFDEPGYKTPWKLSLRVHKDHMALANTKVLHERDDGDWKVVEFAESRPLPSYLVAFAVGPFETVDAGVSRGGAPQRIVTPKGKTESAAYAVSSTRPLLGALEDYFDIPYAYEKLDQIAYPAKGGAMENVGLITYGEAILLIPPAEMTRARQWRCAEVMAHEMAHQWFGDLVTPAWWDDIWLNESFASWMEDKIIAGFRPDWPVAAARALSRDEALRADALGTARKIHQPIESEHDVYNAFDKITYAKGAAVLRMLEQWIGEEAFRGGVRRHLQAHADGNATYQDFVSAMSDAAGRDVTAAFDAFVDQPGAPRLDVELVCGAGGGAPPTLQLAQSRFSPLGSQAAKEGRWELPVCVRWGLGKDSGRACTMLTEATVVLPLPDASRCPDWVLPNDGGDGYYRMALHGDLLGRLVRHLDKLTAAERVTLAHDVRALAGSGDVELPALVDLAAALAKRDARTDVEAAIALVQTFDQMLTPAQRAGQAKLVKKLFAARARKLGTVAKRSDDDDTRQLRASVLSIVALRGGDAAIAAEARREALAWLDDRGAIEPELVDAMWGIAARNADRAFWERVAAAVKASPSRRDRVRLLGYLAQVRDPALLEANFGLVLGREIELEESLLLVTGATAERATAKAAWRFVADKWDEFAGRLPYGGGRSLIDVGGATCDPAVRAEVEQVMGSRAGTIDGGPRALAQTLEKLDICVAGDAALKGGIEAALALGK
jgi:aminopeptidase N